MRWSDAFTTPAPALSGSASISLAVDSAGFLGSTLGKFFGRDSFLAALAVLFTIWLGNAPTLPPANWVASARTELFSKVAPWRDQLPQTIQVNWLCGAMAFSVWVTNPWCVPKSDTAGWAGSWSCLTREDVEKSSDHRAPETCFSRTAKQGNGRHNQNDNLFQTNHFLVFFLALEIPRLNSLEVKVELIPDSLLTKRFIFVYNFYFSYWSIT